MGRDFFIKEPHSAQPDGSSAFIPGDPLPPVVIPDHQLLRCIGRGSYGEVWLARNMMGMHRAVKIVYRKSFDHQRPFERELSGIQKFEPISRSHEGFVDVLHVGIKEPECFYYVMELGDDQTSGQNINPENYSPKTLGKEISRRGKLSFDECLKLGLALSQALAELHKNGLVHRDVKPSNIIFVNGVPKLADIGLVASTNEARSYVGTEGFIPPEGPGAPCADVYGLGKVLYEASTGKDRHEFPELPTLLDKFPDHEKFIELNEVILHACKTEAKERYQSAWDMHSDLLVLANGKSVRRLRFLERRLTALKKGAGVSAVAAVIAVVVLYQIFRERHAFLEARQRQIGANVAYGARAMDSGDLSGALPYFAEALHLNKDTAKQREDRLRFASSLAQCPKLIQMWFNPEEVRFVDVDPSSSRVLAVEWSGAQIFDVKTGLPVSPRFGQNKGIYLGAFSPDGNAVVTAGWDKTATVWNAQDGSKIFQITHPDQVQSAVYSGDGRHIVTACNDNIARVWGAQDGKWEVTLKGHRKGLQLDGVLSATFSHNGQLIATTGRDNTARVWDVASGRQIGPPLEHPSWPISAAFSPDDRLLATACFDHKARVWDLTSGKVILPTMNHDDGVNSVQFSPDGWFIVTAGLDRTVRLLRGADPRPLDLNPILKQSDRVICVAIAPDGDQIATACADGSVRVWDLAGSAVASHPMHGLFSEDARRFAAVNGGEVQIFDTLSNQPISSFDPGFTLRNVNLNPNGNFVLTVALPEKPDDSRELVAVFAAATGRRMAAPFFISSTFTNFTLSRDGKRLLAADGNSSQVWNVLAGAPLSPVIMCDGTSFPAVFSPDGGKIAARRGNKLEVRDAATGRELFPPLEHEAPVRHVEFILDDSRLVTCCADPQFTKCSARFWDAVTGHPIGASLKHNDGVLFASFSPDGSRVVTASEDDTAIVWDANTSRQLSPPLKHTDQVWAAVFSADGKWVATASADKTARVWNAETGEPLTPPLRHLTNLTDARFLEDGRHLLTRNNSGEAWIWELPVDERPVDDLRKLSCLLSGGTIASAGESSPFQSGSLKPVWEELRSKYPAQYELGTNQTAAWHEFEAGASEAEGQWYSAVFQLERLLSIKGDDSSLVESLNRAKKHLGLSGVLERDQSEKP